MLGFYQVRAKNIYEEMHHVERKL